MTDLNRDDPLSAAGGETAGASPEDGRKWKALALEMIQKGSFAEARTTFGLVVSCLPDDQEAQTWFGKLNELHKAKQLAESLLGSGKIDAAAQIIGALLAAGWKDAGMQALAREAQASGGGAPQNAAAEAAPPSPAAQDDDWTPDLAKTCVYTCLFGNYEQLNEFPDGIDSRIQRICFTDNPELTSDSWTIRLVKPAFPMDSVRSQRRVKILAHEYLPPDVETSLYIDNTVVLHAKPETLFRQYLRNADMAVPYHSFRANVFDEFVVVAKAGLDDPARVFEQLNHYQMLESNALEERPYWTAILLRHHHRPGVRDAMVSWYNHVMRYSRRDQLSFNIALHDASVAVQPIVIDNYKSWFHKWPAASNRDNVKRNRSLSMSGEPLRSQIRSAEMDLQVAKQQIAERDRKVLSLSAALAERDRAIQKFSQTSAEAAQKQET